MLFRSPWSLESNLTSPGEESHTRKEKEGASKISRSPKSLNPIWPQFAHLSNGHDVCPVHLTSREGLLQRDSSENNVCELSSVPYHTMTATANRDHIPAECSPQDKVTKVQSTQGVAHLHKQPAIFIHSQGGFHLSQFCSPENKWVLLFKGVIFFFKMGIFLLTLTFLRMVCVYVDVFIRDFSLLFKSVKYYEHFVSIL